MGITKKYIIIILGSELLKNHYIYFTMNRFKKFIFNTILLIISSLFFRAISFVFNIYSYNRQNSNCLFVNYLSLKFMGNNGIIYSDKICGFVYFSTINSRSVSFSVGGII